MMSHHTVKKPAGATGVLVLEDGSVFYGYGLGAETAAVGEVCFNTSMTGYQEILTDPSYAGEIITFTFPHIGNTGTNQEDIESATPHARGMIIRESIPQPSNWRAHEDLDTWLRTNNLVGLSGIDTRALTQRIRDEGAPKGVIACNKNGNFDIPALIEQARSWSGLEGLDLAAEVACGQSYQWTETFWQWPDGYGQLSNPKYHVVAIDYGAKFNILRCLATIGARVTVVPPNTSAEDILALKPDGVFLSNGPGDPAATGVYAVPIIKRLLEEKDLPIFGICLGHQLLALAMGGETAKMHMGHRGANHPVKDIASGHVEITSQNHGFHVREESLPDTVEVTHISLFDGTNEGIKLKNRPVYSVQYHPEASPGPHDSHYLFSRFAEYMDKQAA